MEIEKVFTVEEPPAPRPSKVGRENISAKAVEFCSANPDRWCKVFGYSFTDEQSQHRANSNTRQRALAMRRVCGSLGLSVEFTYHADAALGLFNLYAKVYGGRQ